MQPRLARPLIGMAARALVAAVLLLGVAAPAWAADPPPPGPPYPAPELDRAVYDYAGIFEDATIQTVEATIDEIENRTGAEIVVYTQVTGYGESTSEAESNAQDLINQWGVGRRGFDDGMVILFDLDPTLEHGQVQLYAAEGFRAAYMTNEERQHVFDDLMLPYLRVADMDSAILVAISSVAEYTSAEHAEVLNRARVIDAILGLLVAPALFLAVLAYGLFSWLRYGRDPVYLDDPSILMPAPPERLTAAAGAALMEGQSTRRALTTAMLDLASRGLISFREERKLLGLAGTTVGIDLKPPEEDPVTEAQRGLNRRRPQGPAEEYALGKLRSLGSGGLLKADDLPKFGQHVSTFDQRLEGELVKNKWMGERPGVVTGRWRTRGIVGLIGGVLIIVAAANLPSGGLMIVGGSAIASGIVLMVLAGAMPAVTMPGAMIRAMLHAYRRTLQKTMESARSMQQVVDEAQLGWLETPDQAVVWGTALGLQDEIEEVLKRSLQDVEAGRTTAGQVYLPHWYTTSQGQGFASAGSGGGGLFSSSAVPNIGGMMAALGTIGNSPSSSGSGGGGGGGFSGGSSGGGGGAGGGF